jgi:anti-sigma factor RsiW
LGTKSNINRLKQWRQQMRCAGIRKRISLAIDDRLSPDEKKVFFAHLRTCSSCQEDWEEARAVQELFASAERFSAPYGLTTRVMSNLPAEEPSRWWVLFSRRPLVLRAMEWAFALVVVLTGVLLGNLMVADRVSPQQPLAIQESFSLDLFQATPSGSIGEAYVALAEVGHEK